MNAPLSPTTRRRSRKGLGKANAGKRLEEIGEGLGARNTGVESRCVPSC
jgi:hypothetical protein